MQPLRRDFYKPTNWSGHRPPRITTVRKLRKIRYRGTRSLWAPLQLWHAASRMRRYVHHVCSTFPRGCFVILTCWVSCHFSIEDFPVGKFYKRDESFSWVWDKNKCIDCFSFLFFGWCGGYEKVNFRFLMEYFFFSYLLAERATTYGRRTFEVVEGQLRWKIICFEELILFTLSSVYEICLLISSKL